MNGKAEIDLIDITFNSKRYKQTLNSHKEVLDKYYSGFDEAVKLEGDAPIFLDTNVLLRIYSTSFKAREKMKSFLTDYKNRIVLTSQVQWEYIKNRESVINKFSKDVTQELPTLFTSNILTPINSFITINKTVTNDYEVIEKGLEELSVLAKRLSETINSEIGKSNVSSNKIIYQDEFIELLQGVKLLEPLSPDLLKKIKNDYDENIKLFEKTDIEKQSFKTFPGCAEKKEKLEDPYGDFIIFHEVLHYAKTESCNIIFLTYDTTKGDWIQLNKNPHLHYVENFYLNTGNLIYILDAERTLNDVLDVNFKSLIKKDGENSAELNEVSLNSFLNSYPPFNGRKEAVFHSKNVEELKLNNINTISELKFILDSAIGAIPLILNKYPNFSKLGLLRGCLQIMNNNYKQINESGEIIQLDSKTTYGPIRKEFNERNSGSNSSYTE